jgi:hypothetical protein
MEDTHRAQTLTVVRIGLLAALVCCAALATAATAFNTVLLMTIKAKIDERKPRPISCSSLRFELPISEPVFRNPSVEYKHSAPPALPQDIAQ